MENASVFGGSLDDYLKDEGLYEEVRSLAAKKLLTYQLEKEIKAQHLTKAMIARKMKTSRDAVDNILNPAYNSSLESLTRIADVLGKRLTISLS